MRIDPKNYAVVGLCSICGQGRLIVAREDSSGALYVLCANSEAEWHSPEDMKNIKAATRDIFGRSTLLAREEVEEHPWARFLEK